MVKVEVMMDEKALLAQHRLNLRLIKFSWALFFILIGGSWILESLHRIDNTQKWALIYAGSGGILLLLNLLRIAWKINASKFTIGLGALGLLLGITTYYKIGGISIWAAVVLIIGIFMLFEVLRK
jgi:apolipoprotein N-acyltransferase